jgi:hypothetical protein
MVGLAAMGERFGYDFYILKHYARVKVAISGY